MRTRLTVTIDADLKRRFQQVCQRDGVTMSAIMEGLVRRYLQTHSERGIAKRRKEILRRYPRLAKLLQGVEIDPDEMLPCGMTVREYMSLSDEERERLWDEAFKAELDEWQREGVELDLPPTAVPAGQERSWSHRGRHKQSAARQRSEHP